MFGVNRTEKRVAWMERSEIRGSFAKTITLDDCNIRPLTRIVRHYISPTRRLRWYLTLSWIPFHSIQATVTSNKIMRRKLRDDYRVY